MLFRSRQPFTAFSKKKIDIGNKMELEEKVKKIELKDKKSEADDSEESILIEQSDKEVSRKERQDGSLHNLPSSAPHHSSVPIPFTKPIIVPQTRIPSRNPFQPNASSPIIPQNANSNFFSIGSPIQPSPQQNVLQEYEEYYEIGRAHV